MRFIGFCLNTHNYKQVCGSIRTIGRNYRTVFVPAKAFIQQRSMATEEIDPMHKMQQLVSEHKQAGFLVYFTFSRFLSATDMILLGWNKLYEEKVTPWDFGKPAPALLNLIRGNRVPGGRILVPGCGRGYDVFALASSQRIVTGLDISQIVIDECKKNQRENGVSDTQAEFMKDDFFKFDYGEGFNAVYDYTFLCALPPLLREQWATRMKQIVKTDGLLITLIFPIGDHKDGPPFAVSPQLYRQLLTTVQEGAYFEEVEVCECESFPQRAAREMLGLWRRKSSDGLADLKASTAARL